LAHTTTLEHLRPFLGDLRQDATPPESDEPVMRGYPCTRCAPDQRLWWRGLDLNQRPSGYEFLGRGFILCHPVRPMPLSWTILFSNVGLSV
jgi:hypothetical protein